MKLRPDTWDQRIALSVLGHNEYGLPRWMQGQTVVDIGAHIGSFTIACRKRGASLIHAYEPDPENFQLLVINDKLETTEGTTHTVLCNYAVTAGSEMAGLKLAGYRETDHDAGLGRNTGHVIVCTPREDQKADFEVEAIGINAVLKEAAESEHNESGYIDLLKLDCEGAEWEIIATGDFSKVRLIVGELHRILDADDFAEKVRGARKTLRRQGFDVEVHYEGTETAKFVAIKPTVQPSRPKSVEISGRKPRLLWWGDAEASTGYSRVTENICVRLAAKDWDVHVLGIGYSGDPHTRPYRIYPAHNVPIGSGRIDPWGHARIKEILGRVKPDLLLIQNDHWIIADCLNTLSGQNVWVPTAAYTAVDSENVRQDTVRQLSNLRHTITHTQFGADQLKKAGHEGPFTAIPHGVDTDLYRPYDKLEARQGITMKTDPEKAFIFGYVNANQPRKRLDLAMAYFAAFLKAEGNPDNVWLYLHTNPAGGWDWVQLADFLGLRGRLLTTGEGHLPESCLPSLYSALDVMISTSEGESFGLTAIEGMACGVPQIAVRCGGMPDWAGSAVNFVDPSYYAFTANRTNTLRHIASEQDYVKCMREMYNDASLRQSYRERGLELTQQLTWDSAAAKFDTTLRQILTAERAAVVSDVLEEF